MPPPTPPTDRSNSPPPSADNLAMLYRFVIDSHSKYVRDMISLEIQNRTNAKDIADFKYVVRQDLRTLQSQLEAMKVQIAALAHGSVINGSKANMPDLLTLQSDLEAMEAQIAALVHDSMINGSKATPPDFVCCGTAFGSIEHMREHVGSIHGLHPEIEQEAVQLPTMSGHEETPTHKPTPHIRPEKQGEAVEVTSTIEPVESAVEAVRHEEEIPTDADVEASKAAVTTDNNQGGDKDVSTPPLPSASEEKWRPLAVREMAPSTITHPASHTESFSWEFLRDTFGGEEWSPGFYFDPQNDLLKGKSYWLLEAKFEPFLPSGPGEHGAKLTAFFNSTDSDPQNAPTESNYLEAPVFICLPGGSKGYTYVGHYSQLRFSDKLDYDTLHDRVPTQVLEHWANELASQGRPQWVTNELMHLFWPPPAYDGPTTPLSPEVCEVLSEGETEATVTETSAAKSKAAATDRALRNHARDLTDWASDARIRVACLTPEVLLGSFRKADAEAEPGLRLWWEYLQCVGYDDGFYGFLLALKRDPTLRGLPGQANLPRAMAKENPISGLKMPTHWKGKANKAHVDAGGPNSGPAGSTREQEKPQDLITQAKGKSHKETTPPAVAKEGEGTSRVNINSSSPQTENPNPSPKRDPKYSPTSNTNSADKPFANPNPNFHSDSRSQPAGGLDGSADHVSHHTRAPHLSGSKTSAGGDDVGEAKQLHASLFLAAQSSKKLGSGQAQMAHDGENW